MKTVYTVKYHADVVSDDIPQLPKTAKERIKTAIEQRLMTAPLAYGKPLRRNLHGLMKLRVGDYRVIYSVAALEVIVMRIGHRKDVYKEFERGE